MNSLDLIINRDKIYSAPFEVVPYTEEPFSHHWLRPQPPRIQRSLFNGVPIAHKDIFAQLPKMEANDTEQPSPPLHPPKAIVSQKTLIDQSKSLLVGILIEQLLLNCDRRDFEL